MVFFSTETQTSPTYVTPKNFDFVKPAKEKEVALDASRLENMKKQTKENPYDTTKLHRNKSQKSSMPPAASASEQNTPENEEMNNFSNRNKNNKEIDKHIDLPNKFDCTKKGNENAVDYDECKYNDSPKQGE